MVIMLMDFYDKEKVDNYLKDCAEGKIPLERIADLHKELYDYTNDEDRILNEHYLSRYHAINCKTVAGTGLIMIVPSYDIVRT